MVNLKGWSHQLIRFTLILIFNLYLIKIKVKLTHIYLPSIRKIIINQSQLMISLESSAFSMVTLTSPKLYPQATSVNSTSLCPKSLTLKSNSSSRTFTSSSVPEFLSTSAARTLQKASKTSRSSLFMQFFPKASRILSISFQISL